MKKVIETPWRYTLYQDNEKYYLTVVTGGVALYNLTVELTHEEVEYFSIKGVSYLDTLASEIEVNSKKFESRYIKDFDLN